MIGGRPRSTQSSSSAASDVYKGLVCDSSSALSPESWPSSFIPVVWMVVAVAVVVLVGWGGGMEVGWCGGMVVWWYGGSG